MNEIREGFHDALNKLNAISVKAGVITELAKLNNLDTLSEPEAKKELKKALETFSLVQDYAQEAAELIANLKKKIYKLLKIDASELIE